MKYKITMIVLSLHELYVLNVMPVTIYIVQVQLYVICRLCKRVTLYGVEAHSAYNNNLQEGASKSTRAIKIYA